MCGRFSQTTAEKEKLFKRFRITSSKAKLIPRYNIAPSQKIAVIMNESPDELSMIRWGLIPFWAKDDKMSYKMINARSETIFEKPSYRASIKKKRCLILSDGFYEWQKNKGGKQPYRICMKDEGLFAFAGVWDCWRRVDEDVLTCSIITTPANSLLKPIHERMPVILPPDREQDWLSDIPADQVRELLKPYDPVEMKAYPVSTAVNIPTHDSADLLERQDPPQTDLF